MSILLLLATVLLAVWVVAGLTRGGRAASQRDGTAEFSRAMDALAPRPRRTPGHVRPRARRRSSR